MGWVVEDRSRVTSARPMKIVAAQRDQYQLDEVIAIRLATEARREPSVGPAVGRTSAPRHRVSGANRERATAATGSKTTA
jgi:hypothetical protein